MYRWVTTKFMCGNVHLKMICNHKKKKNQCKWRKAESVWFQIKSTRYLESGGKKSQTWFNVSGKSTWSVLNFAFELSVCDKRPCRADQYCGYSLSKRANSLRTLREQYSCVSTSAMFAFAIAKLTSGNTWLATSLS